MSVINRLEDLLGSTAVATFLEQAWGRNHYYVPGSALKFTELFSWPALNEVLELHHLESPRLRLMIGGTQVPPERYTRYVRGFRGWEIVRSARLDSTALMNLLRKGATIALRSIDEFSMPVRELCEHLEMFFNCRVQANLYASWLLSPGFEPHYDDHDVFVLQVSGRKLWKVFGPPESYPLDAWKPGIKEPPQTLLWERRLEQGDLLYLPRGYWHTAIPVSEPTLHLTIGTLNLTGVDLLRRVVNKAQELDLFRMDLPLPSDGKACFDRSNQLLMALSSLWPATSLEGFSRGQHLVAARPRFNLPELLYREDSDASELK